MGAGRSRKGATVPLGRPVGGIGRAFANVEEGTALDENPENVIDDFYYGIPADQIELPTDDENNHEFAVNNLMKVLNAQGVNTTDPNAPNYVDPKWVREYGIELARYTQEEFRMLSHLADKIRSSNFKNATELIKSFDNDPAVKTLDERIVFVNRVWNELESAAKDARTHSKSQVANYADVIERDDPMFGIDKVMKKINDMRSAGNEKRALQIANQAVTNMVYQFGYLDAKAKGDSLMEEFRNDYRYSEKLSPRILKNLLNLEGAFRLLPKYNYMSPKNEGELWRGVKDNTTFDVLSKMPDSTKFSLNNFTSFSKSKEIAIIFQEGQTGNWGEGYFIKMNPGKANTGVAMDMFSHYRTQGEIVFSPGQVMKKVGYKNYGDNMSTHVFYVEPVAVDRSYERKIGELAKEILGHELLVWKKK